MPTVKRFADDLREAFGAAEIDAALREQGYYASEGGRTIDTRKPLGSREIAATDMVIGPAPAIDTRVRRGR